MKYSEWLNIWLENYVKPTHKIRTFDLYKQMVEKKIVPYLGDYDMDELTPITIQRYITEMSEKGNTRTGKGLSSNSVNGIISVIQSSLQTAFRLGLTAIKFNAQRCARKESSALLLRSKRNWKKRS